MKRRKPTLSEVPYTFELPEQPLRFEVGEAVLYRDEDYQLWAGG